MKPGLHQKLLLTIVLPAALLLASWIFLSDHFGWHAPLAAPVLLAALYFGLLRMLQHQEQRLQNTTAKLEAKNQQLQMALDAAEQALWDWDLTSPTNQIHFSKAYCQMLGYEPNEFGNTQDSWRRYLHPDEAEAIFRRIREQISGKAALYENTYRIQHKDGSYRWLLSRGRLFNNDQGQPVRFIGVASDITDQRHSELQTRLAHTVFNTTHEGVLVADGNNRIIFTNPAFSRITGYSQEEVLGKAPSMLQSGRHSKLFYSNMWQDLLSKDIWSGEIWNRRKNGEVLAQLQTISQLRDLQGNVTHRIAVFSDISVLKNSQTELSFLANYDPLTGLPNRLLMYEHLKLSLQRAQKNKTEGALFILDLDHFKTVNEGLGHSLGDELIKALANRLQTEMPLQNATYSRFGGDEFAIIIDNASNATLAANLAKDVLELISRPYLISNNELFITASLGICLFPSSGKSAEEIFRNADSALHQAKASGRANFAFYQSQLTEAANQKLRIANELRNADENGQLQVYFQPVCSLEKQKIIGCEALVRWLHPERGMIAPMDFITIAEDTGLIGKIDSWVMHNACSQVYTWQRQGLALDFVSVNVSSRLFKDDSFLTRTVQSALEYSSLSPDCLELEITESAMMEEPAHAISMLHRLRDLGIRLAIDDFGTGYSSLGRLKYLPVDKFKIDQTFVRNLPDDPNDIAIIRAIIALGDSMRLAVQAEGVETQEQADFLLEQKCVLSQGYLFGAPMPAEKFHALLVQQQEGC